MNAHSFPVELAEKLGLEESLILQHFYYWHKKNEGNNKNFIDGHYWTYNSIDGFSSIFTYISTYKIRNVLKRLEEEGYVIKGNHNKKKYDRTSWYALTDKAISLFDTSICRNQQMDLSKSANASVEINKPIPDSNTYSNTNINISFDEFWNLYDKKVNRSKCEKKWNALSDNERVAVMGHLPRYVPSTPDKQFRKNPITYLNNRGWEDEVLKTTEQLIKEENKIAEEKKMTTIICPNHSEYGYKVEKGTIKFCPVCRRKMETRFELDYMKSIGLAQ